MSQSTHKASVDTRFLVKRHLKLVITSAQNASDAEQELQAMMGVDVARIKAENKQLYIAYDASFKNLDEIEAILKKHNIEIASTFWNRIKAGWYKNTDENVKGNATHEAHCCNKMPPGKE